MEFLHAAIALLASMVLVLAGMVGWLYWQQQRMFQHQNNITMVIGELARAVAPPPAPVEDEPAPEAAAPAEEPAQEAEVPVSAEKDVDDRVSVDEGPEVVDGTLDTDGLESKTKKELQDILTKRGVPFGKNDNKSALISLLKATA